MPKIFCTMDCGKEEVEESLREIKTVLEKKKALTVQLNFRKLGRKQKSVNELIQQVSTLIEESRAVVTKEKKLRSRSPLLVNNLSVVPGFGDWYNIKYENNEAVYVYKLQENYSTGDLELIVDIEDFISTKKIVVNFVWSEMYYFKNYNLGTCFLNMICRGGQLFNTKF
ncbi:LOW QUALITY PROTEIN: hypothetical protein KUTeg_017679 [Tegillarca granosa]|uniref:Uncharacterized protein n=1 Tax=Tegillarca granosa TaxID=220873 RepID=A0ABQ9EI46_TEGGR|nr:LOW QUALITY PROTEIN: hypothetical protein KUTeg_017679 [Tegillarca granosa]